MCFLNLWSVQLYGEPIQWVDTICYLGVILDMRLTWSPHIDQIRNKAAQKMGVLVSVLNRSDLSTWNGSCCTSSSSIPWQTTHSPHGGSLPSPTLQQVQSKCLRFAADAHQHIGNRQIHVDLRVAFFADHIRSLTKSFNAKLTDVGKPLVQQLGRYYTERGLTLLAWCTSQGRLRATGQLRPPQNGS